MTTPTADQAHQTQRSDTLTDTMTLDVQIFDTDCFGVMWHGAYTKWLEMGRVKLLEGRGIYLSKPDEPEGFVYPVVEQSFRFKRPAKYGDKVLLKTQLHIEGIKLIFNQSFTYSGPSNPNEAPAAETTDRKIGQLLMEATTVNLVTSMDWKVQRRIPASIAEKLGLY